MELANELDKAIINGSGTAPAPTGILTRISTAEGANGEAENGVDYDWTDYREIPTAHLDDRIFTEPGMLRLAIGKDTLTHASSKYNSATVPTMDGIAAMRDQGMMVRYSGRIAAASAATNTEGRLQNGILVSAPYARNCVVPIWQDMYLIVDNLTQHREGISIFTLLMYHGIGYRRSASGVIEGWKKLFFVLSDDLL